MHNHHLVMLLLGCAAANPARSTTPNAAEPEQSAEAVWQPPSGTAQIFDLSFDEPDISAGTASVELKSADSELSIGLNRRDAQYDANSVVTDVATTFQLITGTQADPIGAVALAGNPGQMVTIVGEDRGRPMYVAFATSALGTERHVRLNSVTRERDETFIDMCASLSAETPPAAPAPGRQRVHVGGYWIDVRADFDRVMITYRLDMEHATIRIRIVPAADVPDPAGSPTQSREGREVSDVQQSAITIAGHGNIDLVHRHIRARTMARAPGRSTLGHGQGAGAHQ